MRIGYIKDENGKMVRKFIPEDEVGKNPDVLFRASAGFGDYLWTDEEHMEEAKEALLESMFNSIRKIAKMDEFWIVKSSSEWECNTHPLFQTPLVPQEAKDGKCTVAWRIIFPNLEGYCTLDVAERRQKQLDACFSPNEE
jgi:hypothetical protein